MSYIWAEPHLLQCVTQPGGVEGWEHCFEIQKKCAYCISFCPLNSGPNGQFEQRIRGGALRKIGEGFKGCANVYGGFMMAMFCMTSEPGPCLNRVS